MRKASRRNDISRNRGLLNVHLYMRDNRDYIEIIRSEGHSSGYMTDIAAESKIIR